MSWTPMMLVGVCQAGMVYTCAPCWKCSGRGYMACSQHSFPDWWYSWDTLDTGRRWFLGISLFLAIFCVYVYLVFLCMCVSVFGVFDHTGTHVSIYLWVRHTLQKNMRNIPATHKSHAGDPFSLVWYNGHLIHADIPVSRVNRLCPHSTQTSKDDKASAWMRMDW